MPPIDPDHPAYSPTRQSLPITLLRAREAVMARFRPMLREIDVTEQQWRVLRVLDESGELDVTTISDRAAILAPSLTRILKTLKDRNLLTIRRDENDGRRSLASLTEDGRHLVASSAQDSAAVYADISETFGTDRMRALIAELDAMIDALAPDA